jgi:hypothetical protein
MLEADAATEQQRVERWREQELVRAGFDQDVAWLHPSGSGLA